MGSDEKGKKKGGRVVSGGELVNETGKKDSRH